MEPRCRFEWLPAVAAYHGQSVQKHNKIVFIVYQWHLQMSPSRSSSLSGVAAAAAAAAVAAESFYLTLHAFKTEQ